MITALLDHYIYLFHKRLATLINMIIIKQQCLSRLKIYNLLKNTIKYGTKIEKLKNTKTT